MHEYARKTFRRELIYITTYVDNLPQYDGILEKIHTHSLGGLSYYIKRKMVEKCLTVNCENFKLFNDQVQTIIN